jgi:hypothetical protein
VLHHITGNNFSFPIGSPWCLQVAHDTMNPATMRRPIHLLSKYNLFKDKKLQSVLKEIRLHGCHLE